MSYIEKQLNAGIPLEKILEDARIKDIENLELINMAKDWEKGDDVAAAAIVYEYLILNNFDGNFPYDRLVIIYKKQNKHSEVIRVLEKAVWVFENVVDKNRADRTKKLSKYKAELEKAGITD